MRCTGYIILDRRISCRKVKKLYFIEDMAAELICCKYPLLAKCTNTVFCCLCYIECCSVNFFRRISQLQCLSQSWDLYTGMDFVHFRHILLNTPIYLPKIHQCTYNDTLRIGDSRLDKIGNFVFFCIRID